jgi:hypothetical protein
MLSERRNTEAARRFSKQVIASNGQPGWLISTNAEPILQGFGLESATLAIFWKGAICCPPAISRRWPPNSGI